MHTCGFGLLRPDLVAWYSSQMSTGEMTVLWYDGIEEAFAMRQGSRLDLTETGWDVGSGLSKWVV